ncbi:CCA tRNA nucleotidyltransferase [Roseibium aestuarii]|uniref:CCA tRNA nucleotidyltransferase n=1 Tax=Roseibium aestuarii TaxID=2600299 RepID=A0ABW4JXN2_9HYPH|nr:CCA tRNA nucleotidyltransferase [Roseibium aestuarii]
MTRSSAFDWILAPDLQAVFDLLLQDGDEARVVGGAVRNSLLGEKVDDIDIATTAEPSVVMERAKRVGVRAIGTGLEHGTVTLVGDGRAFEVTTLRADVETFGRKAVVRFGRDWEEDARRRDFTLNALYLDRTGKLIDPLGGLEDCLARRVIFIGDPDLRIREDYLRILRFYRFHATYGAGTPDPEGRAACLREKEGLKHLSAERIAKELLKLVAAKGAADSLAVMQEDGLLELLLPGGANVQAVARLQGLAAEGTLARVAPAVALAVLVDGGEAQLAAVADRLKLSNALRERMVGAHRAVALWDDLRRDRPEVDLLRVLRRMAFDLGLEATGDGLALVLVRAGEADAQAIEDARRGLGALTGVSVPVFPLAGRDLMAAGLPAGPALGVALKRLQAVWIDSDFQADRAALLAVLGTGTPE